MRFAPFLVCVLLTAAASAFGFPGKPDEDFSIGAREFWNERPLQVLRKHGIRSWGDTMRGFSDIRIPRIKAGVAYRLLLQDSKKHRYWLRLRNPQGKWETHFKMDDAKRRAWIEQTFPKS